MRNKILFVGSLGSCLLLLLAIFPPVAAAQTQQNTLNQHNALIQHFQSLLAKLTNQPRDMVWPFFLFFIIGSILALGIVTIILIFKLINPSL